jgi:hypothetical protein
MSSLRSFAELTLLEPVTSALASLLLRAPLALSRSQLLALSNFAAFALFASTRAADDEPSFSTERKIEKKGELSEAVVVVS